MDTKNSVCVVDRNNPCWYYEINDEGKAYCTCNECECSEVTEEEKCHWDPDTAMGIFD